MQEIIEIVLVLILDISIIGHIESNKDLYLELSQNIHASRIYGIAQGD